ncbi:CDP-2,3-bis-(O-geranylgeranyl)-sn-glycerol synthase [Methanolobus mangrovi]|uniref:CDP-archaeol synthase n=2 Tax=Methanolobus mangrovi TaxID=3072977 RepID=A0AA51UKN4_9EURY|nr:CDP-2,3-bis-(O-geranylgeranyl)-sn-glycerol synthase [Methanolobus mangrovi]WMW23456.1 CDP-2,3-bis-(O-geranylgeranyl)-sn-glycerol synthase [Methanolobus mangrovi]
MLIIAVWLMLPAYIPSPLAAVFGGGKPIDGGRTMSDGRRILGDGKTYRGLLAGLFFGMVVGLLQMYYLSKRTTLFSVELPSFAGNGMSASAIIVIFALAFGSLFGDMFMSFFKRRLGLKRGAPLPVVDQLDFVFGAWLLTYIASPAWFTANFTIPIIIVLLVLTPVLHLGTNIIGYFIGVKNEPW